jgi:hypothetical protein
MTGGLSLPLFWDAAVVVRNGVLGTVTHCWSHRRGDFRIPLKVRG